MQMQTDFQQLPPQHPLANASPEVQDAIDQMDPLTISKRELQALIDTVDDEQDGVQIRAFLWGILDTRIFISTITGKEF